MCVDLEILYLNFTEVVNNNLFPKVLGLCEGTKVPEVVIVEKGLTRYGRSNGGYGLYSTHHEQLAP